MGLRKGSKRSTSRSVRGPSAASIKRIQDQKRANALAQSKRVAQTASDARIKASKSAAVSASILDLRSAQTTLRSNITKLSTVSSEGRSASEAFQLTLARQETAAIEADISRQLAVKAKAAARTAAIARQRAKADAIRAAAARKAAALRAAAEKAAAARREALLNAPVNHKTSNTLFALADQREALLAQQAKFAIDQRSKLLSNVNKEQIAGTLDRGQAIRRVNSINQAHARRTDPKKIRLAQVNIGKLRKQAEAEKKFELNRNKLVAAEQDRLAAAILPFQMPAGFVSQGTVSKSTKSLEARLRQQVKGIGLTGSGAEAFARTKAANDTRIAIARTRFTVAKSFAKVLEARAQTARTNSKANAVSAAIKEREARATGQLVGTSTRVKAPKAVGQDFSINLRETLSFGESLVTKFTPAPKVKAVTQQVAFAPSAAAAGKIEVTRASGKKAIVTQSTAKALAERGDLSPESAAGILAPPIIPDIQSIIGPTKPTGKKPSQFTTTAPATIQNAIAKESKPFIQEAFAEEGGSLVDKQTKQELQQNPENIIPNVIQLEKNQVKVVGGFKAGDEVQEVQIPTLSGATFSAVAPTGRNINELQSNEEKKIGNALNAGLGVEVGGTFLGGETSVIFDPQAKVTTKAKPLISPTRDQGLGNIFTVKDGIVTQKPKKKSVKVIKAETLATRLGNAPFITQVDLSTENLRQGSQLLDRSDFFTTDKITGEKKQITSDSLEGQVINRIGEEQDVKNVLNTVQAQRHQAITNAQAEIDPITGQTIRTAGEVALDIARATPEPTVSFTFGAGSAFRPTGQEREIEELADGSFILTKTGGFTDENLPFIQEVLETTPRASVQEGLGFGPPTIELETGKLIEKVNKDGSVEVVKETALFLDPDRFSSQFRPQVGIVSVGKPDVIAETKGGKKFILSQEIAQQLDKEGQLSSPIDNFQTGTKPELESAGLEGIGGTFNLNQNLNATPNSPFALPSNSGQVLESSPVTEDLARSGAVDFPSFIQTASADSGPALGFIGPVAQRPSEQVSIQKPLFDEKTLGLGEVRDKFSFGDFLENPIEGLGQFAGGATRSAQNEVAGIQNIGSLASGGQIPQREFLGTPSQQFYDAVITGALEVGGQNFGIAAQRFGELRQRGIGAVFEDPLGFIQSTAQVLNPITSTIIGIAQDPTVQQKFGVLGQSILDNPFAAAGDLSFQAATFLGPQAVLKVARVAGVIAPKAASAASLGVKLQKGQKIEAALIQSKKGAKKEVVNVLINKGQKLKKVDNGLGGSHALVVNKNTGDIIRVIETTATPVSAKTALIIDNTASVNRKIAKTVDPKEIQRLASGRQKFGNLSSLSKSEQKILDAGKTQAGAILTLDPTGTAQLLGKQGSIKVFQKGGKRVLLKEKTFELIDLKTGNKKITLRQDLAESVTQMPLGARLFDTLTGLESAVKPSSTTAQLPFRATEATDAGVLGKLDFVESGISKSEFERTGVFSPTGTRIGPLPKSPTDIAAALGRQKQQELNVFEDFLSKRGGFVTRETSLGESAGAASFDPFFGRTITPTAEAAGVAGRQFIPEPFGLGTGSTSTVVKVRPRLDTGSLTAKVFDTLSPAQKQAVIEEGFVRGGVGSAKQSGKFADEVRTTALTAAAQGKSLKSILTEVNQKIPTGRAVATGRAISERNTAIKDAAFFVNDKTGFPLQSKLNVGLSGRLQKGINETLKARTKEFDVAIPTGTVGRDAQLTGDIINSPAFAAALKKVKPSVLDDALGISPRRLVGDLGETRLSVGVAGKGSLIPKSFTQTAKSGILKAVDDFAVPKIQRAAALGDDFLNIQRGVIGATSKTVRSVTSVGKKAKTAPQKLIQKVRQPKPTGLLDDLDPSGTLKIGKLGKGSKTIGKTADDLLEVGRTIKPKRGLPVGLITGIGSQVVQQFRPSTVTGIQTGFEQVLNPIQSQKLGVQSSLALVPRQARTPAGRFQFPFAVPKAAQAQAQPFPQRQTQRLLFGTPTPPARSLLVPPFFLGRGGGQGDTGAGDLSARRKFFRVFDVAKTPFGRVERGLGIQVQSSAQIQEVSDVLGRAPRRNVSERFFGEQGNGNGGKRRRRRGDTTFDDSLFSF